MANKTAFEKQRAAAKKSGSSAQKKQTTSNASAKKSQTPVNTAKTTRTTTSGGGNKSRNSNNTKAVQTQVHQPKFQVKETVGREVRYLVSLLVLVLFLFSICLGDSFGIVGKALHDVSVGVFGISAYLFCFAGIVGVVLRMWKAPSYPQYAKNLCVVLFIVAMGILMHIANGAQMKTLAEWYEKATWYTGGVVGGFLGMMLLDLLGSVGSVLLLIGIMIICLVVITEKSAIQAAIAAVRGTRKVTQNVEANVREKVRQHQELRKKAEEEQRAAAASSQMEIHLNRVETSEAPLVLEEAPDEEIPAFLRPKKSEPQKAPETKPQGKKPIKDGILDIPLISYDEYRQKKEAHMAKAQAVAKTEPERTEEPAKMPVVSETPQKEQMAPTQEKAVKKAEPVTKEEQAKVSFGIQQNLFADQQEEQEYVFPSIDLLDKPKPPEMGGRDELYQNAQKLEKALMSFGVEATVTQVNQGPVVTRYELIPSQGVKVSRIVNLADDIALHLAAPAIRIEAPIPGKSAVGIEVPNKQPAMVSLREVIESDVFRKYPSKVAFSLGKAIDGEIKVTNIASMPHLLIAGATGSGKSVCINALLISILYKAHPRDVKLILVDPKVVELSVYNGIPHLLLPVVNDPKKAAAALNWAVQEMNDRYKKFADMNVRDLKGYNEAVRKRALEGELMETLPQIVIVVDELADLMMVAGKEVETAITRLGQMARAAGMHLVLATQRPSVDVINGVIKANIPSRLAFAVSSGVDSKTILDTVGAENLLGRGDMLFQPSGQQATRIQGAFVSDAEVERVVNAVKGSQEATFNQDLKEKIEGVGGRSLFSDEDEKDVYLEQAIQFVVQKQQASISMLQREYRIGFNRAARLIDAMYERGIVGPDEGSKRRKVLMTEEEYNNQGADQDE